MSSKTNETGNQRSQHLELVRALSQQISSAISAIEHNDLPAFQATIARQEDLCHELATKKWSPPAQKSNRDPLQSAYSELAQLNRVYARVLKNSKRCADLLAALYGACGVGYGKEGSSLVERQGLICEV